MIAQILEHWLLLWFGIGFAATLIIWVMYVIFQISYEYTKTIWLCPSPQNIFWLLLGIVGGPISILVAVWAVYDGIHSYYVTNSSFQNWWETPLCGKKEK